MSTLSIMGICQDEGEVIGAYLESCVHLKSVLQNDLKEVILIDGGSKDNTIEIINSYKDKLPIILIEHPFDSFGQQKNRGLEVATGDYIWGCDTDMTWTTDFPEIFKSGFYDMEDFWNFRIIFTADDAYHYFYKWPTNANVRLWKRGPKFVTNFHEQLEGANGKAAPLDMKVLLFENSFRQSDAALLNRGKRYQKFAAALSAVGFGPGPEDRYLNAAHCPESEKAPIPKEYVSFILPSTNFRRA
ncbi:MAG: glycosyltransferase [Methanogenium sp.]